MIEFQSHDFLVSRAVSLYFCDVACITQRQMDAILVL